MIKCICGEPLENEATYCGKCGIKISPAVPKDIARDLLEKQVTKNKKKWIYVGLLLALFLAGMLLLIYRLTNKF